MAGKGLDRCEEALERLTKGQPNNQKFLGVPITNSIMSQEAGFDSGYIKPKRHPELVEKIQQARREQDAGHNTVAKRKFDSMKKKAIESEGSYADCKAKLDAALEREVRLIDYARKLEAQLAELTGKAIKSEI